jgi:hypothetical protein
MLLKILQGFGERKPKRIRSIERYLLDPILIGAYLLRRKVPPNELGLDEKDLYINYKNFGQTKLQSIVILN